MLILESTARDRTLVIKLYFCIVSQIILVFDLFLLSNGEHTKTPLITIFVSLLYKHDRNLELVI